MTAVKRTGLELWLAGQPILSQRQPCNEATSKSLCRYSGRSMMAKNVRVKYEHLTINALRLAILQLPHEVILLILRRVPRYLRELFAGNNQVLRLLCADPSLHTVFHGHDVLNWLGLGQPGGFINRIDLSASGIGDQEVKLVVKSCRNLRYLNISHLPALTNNAFEAIAEYGRRLNQLVLVSFLSGKLVFDNRILDSLSRLPELRLLNISHAGDVITASDILHFITQSSSQCLCTIIARGCTGVQRLREEFGSNTNPNQTDGERYLLNFLVLVPRRIARRSTYSVRVVIE